jgi:hypothetical protein
MKRSIIALSAFIIQSLTSTAFAQNVLKGKIIDDKTKQPLELAVISNKSTKTNALADKEGNFILKNTSQGDSVQISFISYATQTIYVNSLKQPLTVQLKKGSIDLAEVVITTHTNNLTASKALSELDLNMQPVKSAQDLLRLVPGLFIAQHQGGGKAEQIFLRGFDADHGTDVNISVDGMPVNMVSQAHGQGYADLHFLIPETVAGYDFGKGPYYTNKGDLCTAGYVAYTTMDVLDHDVVKIEGGQFNTIRLVTMVSLLNSKAKLKGQSFYVAGEGLYSDGGPFILPEHFQRYNLFGKFVTPLGSHNKLMIIASTLYSKWRASGEIPNRAVAEGDIPSRWGALDTSQGGYTTRTNVNIKLTTSLGHNFTWENQAYYSHYYFNLVSNFTFYYFDSTYGDEFNQHEKRDMGGYNSTLTHKNYLGNAILTSAAGVGFRYDHTHPSWLANTIHGDSIINYVQLGDITESNVNGYIDETLETGKWLLNAGVRADVLSFTYLNMLPGVAQLPSQTTPIVCPKLNAQYTLNSAVQLYVKLGKGFHSNDTRVVIFNEANEVLPAAYGADLGINWKPIPHLFINAALWYLYLQEEFTYGADYGNDVVSPGDKTRREGIDFAGRYQFNRWLFADLNVNLAQPRSIDSAAGHNYLPLAPTFTSTAGLFFRFKDGFNGGISYRYLHNRAANSDYSLTALGYWVTDLTVNYTKKKYELGLSIQNLFNVVWNESQFEYTSRLKNETYAQSVDEVSYTPGSPFFAKFKLAIFL